MRRTQSMRVRLDEPDAIGDNVGDDDPTTPDNNNYDRSSQLPLAPDTEIRVMRADRTHDTFLPAVSYAESDSQKGGVPGGNRGDIANDPEGNTITSESPNGVTTVGGAPVSSRKLSYGFADWAYVNPQPVPIHGKLNIRQNPNSALTKVGLWANEGTPSNTNYEVSSPFAAGVFIG